MQEKKGIIADIIFHNEKNGYTIAVFETEEEQFTAVGSIAACRKGLSLILRGKFTVHPTYGEQFAFSEYEGHKQNFRKCAGIKRSFSGPLCR